jgi:hypothetical protein
MQDRASDEPKRLGRRFMSWRADLAPARRWALNLIVLAVVGLIFWLEVIDFLHFIGL